ncbi:MAG TPA: hypothetical protein VKT54_02565, partial [Steroidobacteraceae bacterium]|nr:hypothetical protein [Steroidobacteraceae bacterium]
FYGGVDYGFGYPGVGYRGGEWRGREFIENRAIVHNFTTNRVSFNGGQGGITARPTSREMAAAREHHVAPIQVQRQQERMAAQSREMRASVNGGRPPIAATPRPGVFSGAGVVAARNSASARAGGFRTAERPNGAERPNTAERPNAGSRGNTAPAPARGNSFAPPRGSAEPQREAPRGAFPQTQREGRGPQSRPQEMRPQERPALQARPPQRAERPQPQERAPQREQPRPQPQREERPQQREERPQQRDERRPQEPPHPTLR